MDGILAIQWLIDLVEDFSQIWNYLVTPIFTIGTFEVSWIGLVSLTIIELILGFKLVKLLLPF